MKYFLLTFVTVSLVLITNNTIAIDRDKTLKFEATPYKNTQVYCENNSRVKPTKSDFELLEYTAMSSDQGDRFILVTLKNTSNGQRIFNQAHIVAILGDCSRIKPLNLEQKFAGDETLTIQLNFGLSKYPILKLLVN